MRRYQRNFEEEKARSYGRCAHCRQRLEPDRKRLYELTVKGIACDERGLILFYCSSCARNLRGKRVDVPPMHRPDIAFLADCHTYARENSDDPTAKTIAARWERLWELTSPEDEARVDAELERRAAKEMRLLALEEAIAAAAQKANVWTLLDLVEEGVRLSTVRAPGANPCRGRLALLVKALAEGDFLSPEEKEAWLARLRDKPPALAFVEETVKMEDQ